MTTKNQGLRMRLKVNVYLIKLSYFVIISRQKKIKKKNNLLLLFKDCNVLQ